MKGVKTFFERNGSTILSGIGSIGVAATSALAIQATPKAVRLIENERKCRDEELSKSDIFKLCWKCYVPAAVIGISTIVCIIGANALNKRQQAALASAYMLVSNGYKEYKNKLREVAGEETDISVQEAIVKEKYDGPLNNYDCLFYEYNYGEFFERSKEDVLEAEHQLNLKLANDGYACLNDLYGYLGLPKSDAGRVISWSSDEFHGETWVDFKHELVELEDGMECYVIDILTPPTI